MILLDSIYEKNLNYLSDKKYLLSSGKLHKIIKRVNQLCNLSIPKINTLDWKYHPLTQIGLYAVIVKTCEDENWATINELKDIIYDLTDLTGESVMAYYLAKENLDKLQMIKDNMALSKGDYPLQIALKIGKDDQFIQRLIDEGIGTNFDGENEKSDQGFDKPLPIHIAVKKNRSELVGKLITNCYGNPVAPIQYFSKKMNLKLSLIALAVVKGHKECLDEIYLLGIEKLSAIRVGDQKWTLLHLVVKARQLDMLNYLFIKYSNDMKDLLDDPDDEGKLP